MTKAGRIAFSGMEAVTVGRPAAEVVTEEARKLGAERVFLMVSNTLNNKTDEIEKVRSALGNLCSGTFDSMAPYTPRADVVAATKMAREVGCDLVVTVGIVTVGGGLITDGAKSVMLCLANDIDTAEGMDMLRAVKRADGSVGPSDDVKPPMVRRITMPTTFSGGEFSAISGVTDERTRVKELIRHPSISPHVVVLDPAVTVHTPEWLWLSTGIRAVDNCVESICADQANPYGDAQSEKGLALLTGGLPRSKADPTDLDARLDCQIGTWLPMGALTTGTPMGASHGIGYGLGAVFDIPHGHTSCIVLPAVMRWNRVANAAKQDRVAAAMGHAGEAVADLLDRFIGGLGMPRRLGTVEFGPENFQRIAEGAMGTPWVPLNPLPIPGPAEVMEILELAK